MKTPDKKIPEGNAMEELGETAFQERTEIANGIEKPVMGNTPKDATPKEVDMSQVPMPNSLKQGKKYN